MKLSQAVVVVNEFTVKTKSGGTRGGTPGDYVMRYMAREDACEAHGPARVTDVDTYVTKYMAREGACESAGDEAEARRRVKGAGGLGAKAFCSESLSMSEEDLRARSREIQKAFDSGKTVLKTVLSFDTDYLYETGVLPEGFVFEKRGDFAGQVDQLKLRYAVQQGIRRISGDFDDLKYVGVIQVDTEHVHCHLAMVDLGEGTLAPDGTQKGKLSGRQLSLVKRGVDAALDESREILHLSSLSHMEQRNVQTSLRRYTYRQVTLYGAPQKLLTLLPEDPARWRAGSRAKDMKAANRVCRDYVEQVLWRSPEDLARAEDAIRAYADRRAEKEGLSVTERERIYVKARGNMVEGCMNSVYTVLKSVPPEHRKVHTQLLDVSAQPDLSPDFKGGIRDLVYRSGAYAERLSRHRREAKRMDAFAKSWELARAAGKAAPGSEALYDLFRVEGEYQAKTADKYRQLLPFLPPLSGYVDRFLEVQKGAQECENFERLLHDKSARQMTPDHAEKYGRETYGIYGGRYLNASPDYFAERLRRRKRKQEKEEEAFREELRANGLSVSADGRGMPSFSRLAVYDFSRIRALDLHDLRGDFSGPLTVDGQGRDEFLKMADRRTEAYDRAMEWLYATGQGYMADAFDGMDVARMREAARLLRDGKPIPAKLREEAPVLPKRRTVALDTDLHRLLSGQVVRTAEDLVKRAEELSRDAQTEDAGWMPGRRRGME